MNELSVEKIWFATELIKNIVMDYEPESQYVDDVQIKIDDDKVKVVITGAGKELGGKIVMNVIPTPNEDTQPIVTIPTIVASKITFGAFSYATTFKSHLEKHMIRMFEQIDNHHRRLSTEIEG